tara:strand:- start:493 stop:873 length:381 start_codon:yes stop_codon:yes gene_type:complete
MAYLLSLAGILSLAPAEQALANKLLDWMRCSTDITEEIRPSVTGTYGVKYGSLFDLELYNNHNSLEINSVTVRLSGTYGNTTSFTRKYEQLVQILPGYSARVTFDTFLDDIDDGLLDILEIRGCNS